MSGVLLPALDMALVYAALGLTAHVWTAGAPNAASGLDRVQAGAVFRSSWWAFACAGALSWSHAGFDWQAAWLGASLSAAFASLHSGSRSRRGLLAAAGVVCAVHAVTGPSELRAVAAWWVAAWSGVFFARAMHERQFWRARLAMHWASFAFVFAVWLPHMIDPTWSSNAHVAAWRVVLSACLLCAALWLARRGTRDLCAQGGTPDPLDPPLGLATRGIYAHIRNPIQAAEVLLVAVHSVLTGAQMHAVYTLCFGAGLMLPMRWYEERRLMARYGAPYLDYLKTVPAFLPRLTRREASPSPCQIPLTSHKGSMPGDCT